MKCDPPPKNALRDLEAPSIVPQQATPEGSETSEPLSSTFTTSPVCLLCRRVLHVDLLSVNPAASNLYILRCSDIKFAFVSTSNDTH